VIKDEPGPVAAAAITDAPPTDAEGAAAVIMDAPPADGVAAAAVLMEAPPTSRNKLPCMTRGKGLGPAPGGALADGPGVTEVST
jgi:hypothetical protein